MNSNENYFDSMNLKIDYSNENESNSYFHFLPLELIHLISEYLDYNEWTRFKSTCSHIKYAFSTEDNLKRAKAHLLHLKKTTSMTVCSRCAKKINLMMFHSEYKKYKDDKHIKHTFKFMNSQICPSYFCNKSFCDDCMEEYNYVCHKCHRNMTSTNCKNCIVVIKMRKELGKQDTCGDCHHHII